ncbi:MAG: hypothetical protein E3K32_00135 [wastewater metagenome]|nr:hypothetical protein [Candidatus Loosdrechtia aerotolerans]
MPSKRSIVLPVVLGSLLFFFIILAAVYFSISRYVEWSILPKLSQDMGIHVECDARRIDFTGIDLGELKLGSSDTTTVFAKSIRLDYSPLRLFKQHIDTIVIDGLRLQCELVDGSFVIPGFDLKNFISELKSEKVVSPKGIQENPAEGWQFPVSFGSCKIHNAVLVCNYNGHDIRMPFDLSLFSDGGNMDIFDCILKLYPHEQEITISSHIDTRLRKASVKLNSHAFQLDRFSDDIAPFLSGLIISGHMNIDGVSDIQFDPFQISKTTVTCEFYNTRIGYQEMILLDSGSPEKGQLPLRVVVSGEGDQWQINTTNISSVYPLPVRVSDAVCAIQFSQETIEGSGHFHGMIDRINKSQQIPFQVSEPWKTAGDFSAKFTRTGEWAFTLSTKEPDTPPGYCKIRYEPLEVTSNISSFAVSGQGEKMKGTVNYAAQLLNVGIRIYEQYAAISIPSLSLTGNIHIDGDFTEGITGVTAFELKGTDVEVKTEPAAIKIPEFLLQGNGHYLKDGSFLADAVTRFEDAEVLDLWYNTKTTGISGELPLQWPCEGLGKEGRVSAGAVYWNTMNLGTASGTVNQKGLGIVFDGEHNNTLIAGLTLRAQGTFDLFSENGYECNLDYKIPWFRSGSVDFGNFLTSAEGISFDGILEAHGNIFFDAIHTKSSVEVALKNSRIEYREKGIVLEGINHTLSVPNLSEMRSAPHQQFQFEKLSIGNLIFYDGKIEFQIESPVSFFIENCGLTWCNGRVYTQAMLISFDRSDYTAVLICDRLNLGEVFEQFGIAKAEGNGTVSGRLPVKYEDGNVSFDSGFLYSAPGDGGIIHVAGLDILDVGIPQETPQYSQISFINAVLKDFHYNWVKILLTTQGEDLFLQMSLDGKPMNPLPFTYNKKLGSFSKIKTTSKGGIYNPVHLDINFRLPLNKIIYYGKSINDIMSMIK